MPLSVESEARGRETVDLNFRVFLSSWLGRRYALYLVCCQSTNCLKILFWFEEIDKIQNVTSAHYQTEKCMVWSLSEVGPTIKHELICVLSAYLWCGTDANINHTQTSEKKSATLCPVPTPERSVERDTKTGRPKWSGVQQRSTNS